MNIEELKNRFETIANEDVDIATFIFDDLSAINKNRQKKYPVLLMMPPASTITPFYSDYNNPLWENFNISLYLLKPWTNEDKKTKSLDQVYRECEETADKFLKNILLLGENEYSLINDKTVTKTRGHHQHVDQLVGIRYNFTLRLFNSLCYGLDQPTNLTAAVTTDNQIDLTWVDNATSETGYEVWRSTDLINYTLAASIAADSTSYNDTGLTAGTIYHYKVRAFDANGGGIFSNVSSKITLSGIVYQKPQLSQQSISYRDYDDGWHLANGTYSYTPPAYPISYAQLDDTILDNTGFYTLKTNNTFGNKDRFTDDLGGQDFVGRGYGIDHLTGLGYAYAVLDQIDWNTAIDTAAASTILGYSDWRITSYREATILYSASLRFYGAYLMTEAYTTAWTAITSSGKAGTPSISSLACRYITGTHSFIKTTIPDKNAESGGGGGYIMVRNHFN